MVEQGRGAVGWRKPLLCACRAGWSTSSAQDQSARQNALREMRPPPNSTHFTDRLHTHLDLLQHTCRRNTTNDNDNTKNSLACDGLLETLGRVKVGGWRGSSFTAHPKIDPETGALVCFRLWWDVRALLCGGLRVCVWACVRRSALCLGRRGAAARAPRRCCPAARCSCHRSRTTEPQSFPPSFRRRPAAGRLFFFRYTFDAPPYVTAGALSKDGALEATWQLDLPRPVMMHDMAITKNFVVFMDHPLVFDGEVGAYTLTECPSLFFGRVVCVCRVCACSWRFARRARQKNAPTYLHPPHNCCCNRRK